MRSLFVVLFSICLLAPAMAYAEARLYAAPDCHACQELLDDATARGIPLVLRDINHAEIFRELVAEEMRLKAKPDNTMPVLIHHDIIIRGKEAILEALKTMKIDAPKTEVHLEQTSSERPDSDVIDTTLRQRFRQWGWGAMLAAGLLDGINPCAFATIIFLTGLLIASKQSRAKMCLTGTTFAVSVGLTYTAIGFSVMTVLRNVQGFSLVQSGLHIIMIAGLILMTLACLFDAWHLHRHGVTRLRLPHAVRLRLNALMARAFHKRYLIPGVLGLGIMVSFLELGCTGQIYWPTLLFMVHDPEMAPQAWSWLILYNVAFVTPLLVVTVLAIAGTGSTRLNTWGHNHTAAFRLITAALMVFFLIILTT